MELSEKGLEFTSIIIAVLATLPLVRWFGNSNLKHWNKHPYMFDSSRFYPIWLLVFCLLMLVMAWVVLRFPVSKTIWVVGSLAETVFVYYHFNPKFTCPTDVDQISSDEDETLKKRSLRNLMLGMYSAPWFVSVLIYLATAGFLLWFLPDVADVKKEGRGYDVDRYYALPFTGGMCPGGSYLNNETGDTLFRVLVSYAFPVEDKRNIYSITEKYPPGNGISMKSRPDYVMKRIPPWMDPSSGRMGSYRTCRRFIVSRRQIDAFAKLDMEKAGLNNNRLVDSIPEPKNSPIWEDKVEVNKYNVYW